MVTVDTEGPVGTEPQWVYERRGAVGHSGEGGHSGAQWVCRGHTGTTGTMGTQAPRGTQGHPGPHRDAQGAYRAHMHKPTGAQARTRRHTDTQAQRHRDTEPQRHRETQGHRDAETQRQRDRKQWEGGLGWVMLCHAHMR